MNPDDVKQTFVDAGWQANEFAQHNAVALHPTHKPLFNTTSYWALIGQTLKSGKVLWVFPDATALDLLKKVGKSKKKTS